MRVQLKKYLVKANASLATIKAKPDETLLQAIQNTKTETTIARSLATCLHYFVHKEKAARVMNSSGGTSAKVKRAKVLELLKTLLESDAIAGMTPVQTNNKWNIPAILESFPTAPAVPAAVNVQAVATNVQ